jgi:hypothetical protein
VLSVVRAARNNTEGNMNLDLVATETSKEENK